MADSSKNYEPTPRWGCLSTLCGGQVFVWGGYSKGFGNKAKSPELERKIEIFDPFKEQWKQATTRGDIPPVVNEGACCSSGSHLYAYGGNSYTSENGCLHQLHIATLTWKEICPHQLDGPMKKIGAAMVVSDNKVVLFGGHGVQSNVQSGSQFIKNDNFTDGHGKTNELHVFDLKKGEFLPIHLSVVIFLNWVKRWNLQVVLATLLFKCTVGIYDTTDGNYVLAILS